jgi:alkylhydroperoxidase family enzyme
MIEETEGRPTGLDAPAKLVLKAAREMTSELAVSDASFEALRRHFDPERLIDLVMTIAFYCGVVRLLASLQIDVEDDYRRYLEDYPLPARP